MNGPAAAPKKCPECIHTQGELDKSRALVTLLDTGNEEVYDERDQLKIENAQLRALIAECVEVLTTCEISQESIMHDKLREVC